jgi:aspartyl-tRNA(Asn)/glutamyl-tRNA(Gln) amidotransferase subunit A
MPTLIEASRALAEGRTTSVELVEACLSKASDPGGEGRRVFIDLQVERAREAARAADERRSRGKATPWTGIPISVKDLFDMEGQITRAGSRVLADAPPAVATAPSIARLIEAGFVVVGRTNMTEFAYSGVGLNPHYGTPLNPWDRTGERIPGGSSSGAAVSVTDGMALAGIGTDTGGSCRIPAALTGIVGFKPTARRVPLEGVYPLSPSLDSVGPLAVSVDCAAILDDVLAGGEGWTPELEAVDALRGGALRLAVLDNYVTEGLDQEVAAAWRRALDVLARSGVRLERIRFADLERLPDLNARGGIAAAEAWAHHAARLEDAESLYDPRVGGRIRAGASVTREELDDLYAVRSAMIEEFGALMQGFDAIIAPTVPMVAPRIAEFEADDDYVRLNLALLKHPSVFNFLDGCAISIPVHRPGAAPVGLMLAAPGGADRSILTAARTVEDLLAPS